MHWLFVFLITVVIGASGSGSPNELLLNLQEQVLKSESQIENLKPNQERLIQFASPAAPNVTPISLLYFHGFSASRKEISPTVENLAEKLKANVFFGRLKGHGINSFQALKEVTMEDWENDLKQDYSVGAQLGQKTVVIATSTSATLLMNLISQGAVQPSAVVLISPNFGFERWDSELLLWPLARYWVEWVMGAHRSFTPKNQMQSEFWTTQYPYRVTVEVMRTVQKFRKSDFQNYSVPTLVLMNPKDSVVDPEKIKSGLKNIKPNSPCFKKVEISNSEDSHVLAGVILSPSTTDKVVQEIHDFLSFSLSHCSKLKE